MIKLLCEVTYEDVNLMYTTGDTIADDQEDSTLWADLSDCCASGDVEEACTYFLNTYDIDWRTVRKVSDNPIKFENLPATPEEITAAAESIYFESETDFKDQDNAKMYLIWQAASDIVEGNR